MSISIKNATHLSLSNTISKHHKKLKDTTRKISSGEKVNKASDNPAGIAIRDLMRSNISAMDQGYRNTQDASSMLQTADGAMQTINGQLSRMKELAMQASNGIYSPEQRSIINKEYQQIAQEVTRIANATEFNGVKLLDGTAKNITVHFGTGNNPNEDFYAINIDSATAESLGLGANAGVNGGDISTQQGAKNALDAIDNAIAHISSNRGHIGAMQNRLEATSSNITVQSSNLRSSESRISDADIVNEMVKFVRDKTMLENNAALFSISSLSNTLVNKKI